MHYFANNIQLIAFVDIYQFNSDILYLNPMIYPISFPSKILPESAIQD